MFAVCSFGFRPWHPVFSMPSRRLPPPAIQIANILLDLDWIERHRRYGWLRNGNSNRDLAAEIAAVMSPDLLLAGASTGAKPERVIPLNDVPRPPNRSDAAVSDSDSSTAPFVIEGFDPWSQNALLA